MAEPVVTEVRGRTWTMSLQRLRSSPEPGRSSNLGAAPLVAVGGAPEPRAVARIVPEERLWVAVSAPARIPVTAALHDGRVLADDILSGPQDEEWIHRLSRVEGRDAAGVGAEDAAPAGAEAEPADSLRVTIGSERVGIALLGGERFDALYGPPPPPPSGEPQVYGGWRLP